MGWYGISLAMMAGVTVYVACNHLLVALRGRQPRLHTIFGMLAILVAVHQGITLTRLQGLSLAAVHAVDWWNWLVELAMYLTFTVFLVQFTGRGRRSVLPAVGLFCALLLILHLVSDYGFAVQEWSMRGDSPPGPALAGQAHFRVFSLGYYIFAAGLSLTVFWGLWASWRSLGDVSRLRGLGLLCALSIVTIAIFNSLGDDFGFWETPPFIDHSFVAMVVLMSLVLSDEVLLAARLTGELAERESFLRSTLDAIDDAVLVCDPQGLVLRLNPAARRLCGCEAGFTEGTKFNDLLSLQRADDRTSVSFETLPPAHGRRGIDLIMIHDARDDRRVNIGAAAIEDEQGRAYGQVLVIRDITEQHAFQQHLHQLQKMEAVGQLAGGLAHDFNNMLGGVIGFAELALEQCAGECGGSSRMKDYLQRILQASERAGGLTRQLLAFSRKQDSERVQVDMHAVILEVVDVLERSVGPDIKLRCELQSARSTVLGDLSQLHAVLLNLGLNARDAMPEGGNLVFTSREVHLDELAVKALPEELEIGAYLQISVSDSGMGMDEEVCSRIFEPFFTTKEVNKGTGLGLSMAFGTLRDHDGLISVSSQPGEGTVFELLLPLGESAGSISSGANAALPSRPARVLVVDDEEAFREIASMVLRELGHQVECVGDGRAALARIEQEAAIDLVILDMIMPHAGGAVVHDAIRRRAANLPVILSSGFAATEAMQRLLADPYTQLVQKPYRRKDFLRAVTRALRGGIRPPG